MEVGVERQRADCIALAERLWPSASVRVFIDNDLSAADPSVQRPQWQALLDALRRGEVDELVAYDQSRLTRQPPDARGVGHCADPGTAGMGPGPSARRRNQSALAPAWSSSRPPSQRR
jgi:hypothetical protein